MDRAAQLEQVRNLTKGILGGDDVDELVHRFSLAELQDEVHAAKVWGSVAQTIGEDADAWFFRDYTAAARLAVEIARSFNTKLRAKRAPDSIDVQAIKERTDIVALISRYTQLRKVGSRFVGICPLHDDRHPSLTVYPNQQTFHCFGCGTHGDVITFIMLAERLDFRVAVATLAGGP